MRKVLSFVLVLALVLGSFSFAFGAVTTPSDVKGTDYETPVQVLMSLGIVTGYPDGTYKPGGAVTRAEMAAMIVRSLGLEDTAQFVAKSNYSDMAGNWADKYVAVASGKNIVKGYPDGTFKPNNQVSFAEAITMIVRALGYIDGCESLAGTWPANYLTLAEDLGITDDVKVVLAGTADRGAIAQMIYNALTCYTVTVDKEGSISYYLNNDDEYVTLLTKLDCTEEENQYVDPDLVDDEDTLCDLSEYVYAHVTWYLNDDDQIVAVKELTEDDGDTVYASVKGEFDFDGANYGDGDITVTDANGDDYDVDGVEADTPVYLNGEETTMAALEGANEILDGWNVTVYGAYEDGEDDDVFTTVYGIIANVATSEWLVGDDDVDDIADANEDGNGTVFDVELPTIDDDGDELDLADITVAGDATALGDIKANDVVTVYASANNYEDPDKVTFHVKRATAEFKVKKVDTEDDEIYSTDGTVYSTAFGEFNDGCTVGATDFTDVNDVEVGTTYTAYLDEFGYILYMEDVDDAAAGNYAIVVALEEETSFDDAQIKLFTQEGDTTTFDVDSDAYDTTLAAKCPTGSVIEYDTNSAGDVDDIDRLTGSSSMTEETYKASSDTLDSQDLASDVVFFDLGTTEYAIASNAVTPVNDDDWDVISKLTDDEDYTGYYYMNDDDEINVVLITVASDSDVNYFAVNKLSKAEDADEEAVFALDGYAGATAANDVLTTDDDDAIYSSPAVFVVEYDGDAIDGATWIADITDGNVESICAADYSIEHDVEVTTGAKSDYFKTADGVITLADDCVYYLASYDDSEFDVWTVGDLGDVDAGDVVTYIMNDDDEVALILIWEEDDVEDAVAEGTIY